MATMEMNMSTLTTSEAGRGKARGPVVAELKAVTKRYGAQTALDGISLRLYHGEVISLLGPNGAGKTTSVRLMLGLTRPDSGTVEVFGHNPKERAVRMRIGAMLQVGAGGVPSELKVREHIDLFRSYYSHPLPEDEIISIAGLEGIENRPFGVLSGGQKQRVLFALALCGNPDLLFLDEPTVGMDVETRRSLWNQIRGLTSRGKTVLLTTHYLEEADQLSDRILVVQCGQVVAEGTPAEIKATQGVRKIRCKTALDQDVLSALPLISGVTREGSWTIVATRDPDTVLRNLMQLDPQLSGLEIGGADLEDAFLAITNQTKEASH